MTMREVNAELGWLFSADIIKDKLKKSGYNLETFKKFVEREFDKESWEVLSHLPPQQLAYLPEEKNTLLLIVSEIIRTAKGLKKSGKGIYYFAMYHSVGITSISSLIYNGEDLKPELLAEEGLITLSDFFRLNKYKEILYADLKSLGYSLDYEDD